MLRKSLQNSKQVIFTLLAASLLLVLMGPVLSAKALAAEDPQIESGLLSPYPAPYFVGITHWLNSEPVDLKKLRGKVVLIEFWSTSCPYCQSSLRYFNEWYNLYHSKGFEVIGVHSPKEEWEKNIKVVKDAVAEYKIHYPVAIDNNFETWMNYGVSGWPACFLIDRQGKVVYVNYGASNFNVLEDNIKILLGVKA